MNRFLASSLAALLFLSTADTTEGRAYEYSGHYEHSQSNARGKPAKPQQKKPVMPRKSAAKPQQKKPSVTRPTVPSTPDIDTPLEGREQYYIGWLKRTNRLSKNDRVSLVVYDIDNRKTVVSINEDSPRISASTMKVYPLLAFYTQVSEGNIRRTPVDAFHLYRMIKQSNNKSANAIMRRVAESMGMDGDQGPRAVQEILNGKYPYFTDTSIVELIPEEGVEAGRTLRNKTSVHDLNRFYVQAWLGNLPYSENMLWYLNLEKRDRVWDETCIPEGVEVFNKTGTLYGQVSDSAVISFEGSDGRKHAYSFAAIIEDKTRPLEAPEKRDADYKRWSEARGNYIRRMSEGAFDFMLQQQTGEPYMCQLHRGRHLLRLQ